jgi:formylglycine-generating enzyme required for sulfatase activity/tRNA A-37 threonylcarbamoyl transferase component Bud32
MFQPNDSLGPYTLLQQLGNGQFGEVWKAQKRDGISPPRAIKLPLDPNIKWEDVQKEARVWLRASGHPNVVPLIEADQYDGHIVLASEYVEGGSLLSWLRQSGGKAPSLANAIEIMTGVLAGLEYLHQRQIIHRDLKPANILLQSGIPRLADFGLSRVLSSQGSGSLAGTLAYMAPEAFDSKHERTGQTDVWAAGVILYELLTGRLPFPQQGQGPLIKAILTALPAPLPSDVPEPLRAIVWCALEKELEKRYKTAAAMREALLRVNLHPEPPPPPGPLGQEKRMTAAVVVVVLLLVVGLLVWNSPLLTPTAAPAVTPTATPAATPSQAEKTPALPSFIEDLGNGVKLELVALPGGTFMMGSNNLHANENPAHRVTISPFTIGKYEVTQEQWRAVMGDNPSFFTNDVSPVESVSWEDVQMFCRKLSQQTNQAYRLPTEAEWEYACRAGEAGSYAGSLEAMAWYDKNSEGKTHPVGLKQPNAWGLYDMHGNVWEWVQDRWHKDYNGAPTEGTAWENGGDASLRVRRGGSWIHYYELCRSANRDSYPLVNGVNFIGFRVVRSAGLRSHLREGTV